MQLRTALFLILLIILTACSSNDPAAPAAIVEPNVGSTFSYEEYSTDTTTGAPIDSTRDTSLYTFVETGLSMGGKTNVAKISVANNNGTTMNFFNYEANGDVSIMGTTDGSTLVWMTFPVTTKSTLTSTLADTTIDLFGVAIHMKITMTISYLGSESLLIDGKTINAEKMKQTTTTASTVSGSTTSNSSDYYVYYAPSLGFIAKAETMIATSPVDGSKLNGSVSMLLEYVLK